MQGTLIKEILTNDFSEQSKTVMGWVRSKRESKKFAFLVINDGSCQGTLQCIVDADQKDFGKLSDILTGASVKLTGVIVKSPAKGQAYEMQVKELSIVGKCGSDYPLQKKGHSLEFLREISQFRSRTNTFGAVFRVRNTAAMGVHDFFQGKHFNWVHTPIITGSDCEGAGELFQVSTLPMKSDYSKEVPYKKDFFGKASYLTVSGQLQAEVLACSHNRVYTFGPTFRAENSNTSRHLAEFWMVEPEMEFADIYDDMQCAEDFLKHVMSYVLKRHPEEMAFFEKHYKEMSVELLQSIVDSDFTRITYTDAVDTLLKSGKKFEFPVSWGIDLQSEHEKFLTDEVYKGPVIIYNYPKSIKPFYMRVNDDGKTVAAMDVLVPRIGEIIGGSQREERLDVLQQRMDECGVHGDELEWYKDLRRYGTVPHAGFGLGFERLVQYVTGMTNIRDVIPFPRTPGSIRF